MLSTVPTATPFLADLIFGAAVLFGSGTLYYFRREQGRIESDLRDVASEVSRKAALSEIKDLRHDLNRAIQNRDDEMRGLREEFNRDMAELDTDVKNLGERLVDMIRAELGNLRTEHQRERAELNNRLDQMILALRMRQRE